MVRHVDKSSLIRSKHCENESGDCMYPGRLYVSYHKVYTQYVAYPLGISSSGISSPQISFIVIINFTM